MSPWRNGLLVSVLAVGLGGYGWMFAVADGELRGSLGLMSGVFVVLTLGAFWHYRARLTERLISANLALGSVVHVAVAGLIVVADKLWERGLMPAIADSWTYFLIGVLGVGGAFFTWTRARGTPDPVVVLEPIEPDEVEPPPPPTAETIEEPDWAALGATLAHRPDPLRLKQLNALQRVSAALTAPDSAVARVEAAQRVVNQEVLRLATDSAAEVRDSEDDDVLSQAASLLEWGAQKLPELGELDVSDLMMAKVIADIRASKSAVRQIFVDHRKLLAIHPIDRATADEKCNQRAEAARAAAGLIEANGMRLSEELIAAHEELAVFKSVTGFQVVQIGEDRYVTFEGNGRREALKRAFPDRGVLVEVRLYEFDDSQTHAAIVRRIQRVRSWKAVVD